MSEKRTSSGKREYLTAEDLARLYPIDKEALKRKRIDYSDNPKTDAAFWEDAEWVVPERKMSLGVRFDKAVVNWFKSLGPGYQTKMNAVLKTYMEHQLKKAKKSSPPKTSTRNLPASKKRMK